VVWRADTLWTNVLLYIFLLIYDGNVSTPRCHDALGVMRCCKCSHS
jgi:hypothetical protein